MALTAMAFQFKRLIRVIVTILLISALLSTYLLDRSATLTDDVTRPRDRSIDAVERHCFLFDLGGRMFDQGGRGAEVCRIVAI